MWVSVWVYCAFDNVFGSLRFIINSLSFIELDKRESNLNLWLWKEAFAKMLSIFSYIITNLYIIFRHNRPNIVLVTHSVFVFDSDRKLYKLNTFFYILQIHRNITRYFEFMETYMMIWYWICVNFIEICVDIIWSLILYAKNLSKSIYFHRSRL